MFSGMFRSKDWFVIGPLGILAIALGCWGFAVCQTVDCKVTASPQMFFRTIGLVRGTGNFSFGVHPWQLVVAQFLLPALALFGAAKLLLINLRRDMRVAFARRARNHTIVCGLGETGLQVVEGLREAGKMAVAITLDADTPNALACERLGVAVLKGNAAQRGMLQLAGLRRAAAVVMTTGSDAQNLEIGLRAAELLEQQGGARDGVKLLPEMRSDWLLDTLLTHRTAVFGGRAAEFHLFNTYVNAVRSLLRSPAFERTFLDSSVHQQPHIVMAGFGRAGTALVRQIVQSSCALPGVRPALTIFDAKTQGVEATFRSRHAGLARLADFAFCQRSFDIDDAAGWEQIENDLRAHRADVVIVALGDDETSLHTALQFRACLDRLDQMPTPVFVRQRQQQKLGDFVRRVESHLLLPDRLVSFGDLRHLTSPQVLLGHALDRLARAVHEVYLATTMPDERSPAAVPWDRLPERFKVSNRAFADHIPVKLRSVGYRLVAGSAAPIALPDDVVEALARIEHWRWCVEQRSAGWSPGDPRDDVLKRHPLLRDWEALPDDARAWNRDMVRRIPEIVGKIGLVLRPEKILRIDRDGAAPAQAMLGTLDAATIPILIVDPLSAAAWAFAATAVATRGARLRLRWRGAPALPAIEHHMSCHPGLAAAVEAWVSA